MTISDFRKKIDSRRRTQGLTHVSTLETIKRGGGEPIGVRLVVSVFTPPESWLQVVKSCSEFATAEIEGDLTMWAEFALESQKIKIKFFPVDGGL